MKRHLLAAGLCLLAILPRDLSAAEAGVNPSMNPDSGKAEKDKNPFGISVGKERPKDAKTEITARKQATFDNATSIATFEGNVVVKDPQFTLFCDKLVVTMGKDRKGMQQVDAVGNVIIVQENTDSSGKVVKSIGRAGKAVYTPASGDVTLTISPSIQHGINMQVGEPDTIMKLNRSGKSETIGVSKTSIVDQEGGQ